MTVTKKALGCMLACCAVLLCAATARGAEHEAIEPGSFQLGGAVAYQSIGGDGVADRVGVLTIAPNAMVFLFSGFSVGAEVALVRMSEGDEALTSHRYLFKTQFIVPGQQSVKPFISGGIGFIRYAYKTAGYGDFGNNDSDNGMTLQVGGGIYAFLNDHYALVAGLHYTYDKLFVSQGNTPTQNTMSVSIGFAGFIF